MPTYPLQEGPGFFEQQLGVPVPRMRPAPGALGATPGINPAAPAPGSGGGYGSGALQIPASLLTTIQQERQQQENSDRSFDLQAASMGPENRMALQFRQAGRQFGALANNLLGGEQPVDPRIAEYQRLQSVMQPYANVDYTDPVAKKAAFSSMAQDLIKAGFTEQGFKMIDAVGQIDKDIQETLKTNATIESIKAQEAQRMAAAGLSGERMTTEQAKQYKLAMEAMKANLLKVPENNAVINPVTGQEIYRNTPPATSASGKAPSAATTTAQQKLDETVLPEDTLLAELYIEQILGDDTVLERMPEAEREALISGIVTMGKKYARQNGLPQQKGIEEAAKMWAASIDKGKEKPWYGFGGQPSRVTKPPGVIGSGATIKITEDGAVVPK